MTFPPEDTKLEEVGARCPDITTATGLHCSELHIITADGISNMRTMPPATVKLLKHPKLVQPDASCIPYINICVKNFLWVIFVTTITLLKTHSGFHAKEDDVPCVSHLASATLLWQWPRVCHQNNARQTLLTAGVYRFSQQVSSPAADKKNKHLPKKMKANAKMSHRFPVKIPF